MRLNLALNTAAIHITGASRFIENFWGTTKYRSVYLGAARKTQFLSSGAPFVSRNIYFSGDMNSYYDK